MMKQWVLLLLVATIGLSSLACGPSYFRLRKLGREQMEQGDYGAARRLFRQADMKNTQKLDNLYDMAVSSMMLANRNMEMKDHGAAQRELDEVIGYCDRMLRMRPGLRQAMLMKSRALELKGQPADALALAEWNITNLKDTAGNHLILALELEQRGDWDGALQSYKQAVEVEPDSADVHVLFAEFLIRAKRFDAARFHVDRALEIEPNNRRALNAIMELDRQSNATHGELIGRPLIYTTAGDANANVAG